MNRENDRKKAEERQRRNEKAREKLVKDKQQEKLMATCKSRLEKTCSRLEKHLGSLVAESNKIRRPDRPNQ